MGVNQVNWHRNVRRRAFQNGTIGVQPLLFTQFPVATVTTTLFRNQFSDGFCCTAGTALATGKDIQSRHFGRSGQKSDSDIGWKSQKGRKKGWRNHFGQCRSCHARCVLCPSARPEYVLWDCARPSESRLRFLCGRRFPETEQDFREKRRPRYFPIFEAGYTVARGYNDYKNKASKAEKMILIQEEALPSCLPYAIDRKPGDLTWLKSRAPSTSWQRTTKKASSSWWKAERSTGLVIRTMPPPHSKRYRIWTTLSKWPMNSIKNTRRKRWLLLPPTTKPVVSAWEQADTSWTQKHCNIKSGLPMNCLVTSANWEKRKITRWLGRI